METIPDIDHLLPLIGELGLYQILVIGALSLTMVAATYQMLIMYFAVYNPSWQCANNSVVCNMTGAITTAMKDKYKMRCSMDRKDWEYTEADKFSVVTEFGLYCDKESYVFIANSLFFFGMLIGAIVLGWCSDKFGRKKVLIPCCILAFVLALASSFATSYWMFVACRIVIGALAPGCGVQMFVIASEIVGTKYRPATGITLWLWFTLALVIMGVKAMYIREWKWLMIYCTAPYLVTIIPLFFIPESLRWLHINGRHDEIQRIAKQVARVNKKPVPNFTLRPVSESVKNHKINPLIIFKGRKICLLSLNVGLSWMVNGLVYFGCSLAVDDLGGNIYRDYIFGSFIEFPAALAAIFGCMYLGRRATTMWPLLLGGIFCVVVSAIPEKAGVHWKNTRVAAGLLGKFFITTSYDGIYTWTIELYPTQIRSEGLGFVQICSRVGAMAAPWVAKWLRKFHTVIPFALMGGMAIVASIFLRWLPETKDKQTAEVCDEEPQHKSEEKEMIMPGEEREAYA